MAKRKSTPAPTLAQLRSLAKRKGYDTGETIGTIEVVPDRDDDARPVMTFRFYEIRSHRVMARLALFAALCALPDAPSPQRPIGGHHG